MGLRMFARALGVLAVWLYAGVAQAEVLTRDCAHCPELVAVPGGSFIMGREVDLRILGADEGPPRTVTIAPFLAGRYEVTVEEWQACVDAGACQPSRLRDGPPPRPRTPVVGVTWVDTQIYLRWLSGSTGKPWRLLSEAEWEYAARAGTTTMFWWGDEISTRDANYNGISLQEGGRRGVFRRKPVPVGRFRANAFGLHDVHGNVREWVADCYVPNYVDAPVDGAPRTDGPCTSRVLRGGSWVLLPETLRSGNRFYERPLDWNSDIGFRVARTP